VRGVNPVRVRHKDLVVACSLAPSELPDRVAAWQELRARFGLGAELLGDGARLWLRPEGRQVAESLVRDELACCTFLDVEVVLEEAGLRVDLTSPVHEGALVARALAGLGGG
jgi:hypothetical protein